MPAGLRKDHATKAGVWARIVVSEGRLGYRVHPPLERSVELAPGCPGIVVPEARHHVEGLTTNRRGRHTGRSVHVLPPVRGNPSRGARRRLVEGVVLGWRQMRTLADALVAVVEVPGLAGLEAGDPGCAGGPGA